MTVHLDEDFRKTCPDNCLSYGEKSVLEKMEIGHIEMLTPYINVELSGVCPVCKKKFQWKESYFGLDTIKDGERFNNSIMTKRMLEKLEGLRINVDAECFYQDRTGMLREKYNRANEMLDDCMNIVENYMDEQNR